MPAINLHCEGLRYIGEYAEKSGMRGEFTRRRLLASIGTGVVAATAGCSGSQSTETVEVAVAVGYDREKMDQMFNETIGAVQQKEFENPEDREEAFRQAEEEFQKKQEDYRKSQTEDLTSKLEEEETASVVESLPEAALVLVEAEETYLDDLLELELVRSLMPASEFQKAKESFEERNTTTPE